LSVASVNEYSEVHVAVGFSKKTFVQPPSE
jgi:hypothetical protein